MGNRRHVGDLAVAGPHLVANRTRRHAVGSGNRRVDLQACRIRHDNYQDREDRRKHLDLISAAINRMAGSSTAAKGWSITLAGAAFGVALVRDRWPFIALGILVLLAFAVLDARYLDNEPGARCVYNEVADENSEVPLSLKGLATQSSPSRWWWPSRYISWSILYFYGPLALVKGGLLAVALFAAPAPAGAPGHADQRPDNHHQGR
jgi:hypothetical protein